jgi:hypothetical protein
MTKPEDLTIKAAEQVLKAMEKGHVATPKFKPEFLRDMKYMDALRGLVKQAVYSNWNVKKVPSTLLQIYRFVEPKIKQMVETGQWNSDWAVPGKRTVDRRVNECADPRFWEDGVTPIIAVKAGNYMPNPYLFEGEVKDELDRIMFFEGN